MTIYDVLKSSLVGLGSHHASRRRTDYRFRRPMHCLHVAVVEAGPKVVLGQPILKTTGSGEIWYLNFSGAAYNGVPLGFRGEWTRGC